MTQFHELVGDPLAFAPIFLEIKKHTQSGMRFYHPAESPYLPKIESFLGVGSKNALSFFKVLDGPGIVEWLSAARYLGAGFGELGRC